jgi:acyl carrier protein
VTQSTIERRVIEIVRNQLGEVADKAGRDTSFINDLGADSLDTVELVMEFEEKFKISISDENAEKIQTVGDACSFIVAELVKKNAAEHLGLAAGPEKDGVSRDTSLAVGGDTSNTGKFLKKLEGEFGIQIPAGDAAKIQTVGNAIDYVASRA